MVNKQPQSLKAWLKLVIYQFFQILLRSGSGWVLTLKISPYPIINSFCGVLFELMNKVYQKLWKAVLHMHKQRVVHRDIKAENILYNPITNKMKLFDFSCATYRQVKTVNFLNW